jgi:hypothetical protein
LPPLRSWDLEDHQDQTWPRLFPLAVFVLLLYPAGIFVLFASLLYYIRKALDNKAAKHVLGALYARYKPQFFFWELIMLSRKVPLPYPPNSLPPYDMPSRTDAVLIITSTFPSD